MDACKYCQRRIPEGEQASWEDGQPVCSDCGVILEPERGEETTQPEGEAEVPPTETTEGESAPQSDQNQQEALDLMRCFRELQFVRFRQVVNGESDAVLLKRPILEVITMMEFYLNAAKAHAVKLEPNAILRARFGLLNAVCLGLGYATMHPNPSNE